MMLKLHYKKILVLIVAIIAILAAEPLASTSKFNTELKIEAQQITNNLSTGDYESPRKIFTSEMKSKLSAKQLGEAWQALVKQYGSFKDMKQLTYGQMDAYHVVEQTIQFGNSNFVQRTVFNSNGLVAGLYFLMK